MTHLPDLISDLAFILILAAFVTILFKRMGQPLVLGYIVAGFLAGPHMPYTPTVADSGSIQTWADIGVIFLMFTLGLEFSFKKILQMGSKPVIAACTVMFCMMSLGTAAGHAFGWSNMDSLFLGGMLAMSSTTIIYKAFDDLGLRSQKFTGEVLSVLILEDILGILLMVILSAVAVSQRFEGSALAVSMLKLAFFLALWFIVGIYLVPLFLRKTSKWMGDETLLIVSLGLCFTLVFFATRAGYSSAFGAFLMGSILAETVVAEKIEHLVAPVKDLFGAIFFVSVGMLVDPAVLMEYGLPIFAITLVVLVGQMFFGTVSFLVSGQPLRVALQCGFSLAQIGEFAFIIASLGISLGVTSPFLYPVVVAVSIITTFLTPYMIRLAEPAYSLSLHFLPNRLQERLDTRRSAHYSIAGAWAHLLKQMSGIVAAYSALSVAAILLCTAVLLPFSRGAFGHWSGNAVSGILTIALVSPFLRAIVMKKNHSEDWKYLESRSRLDKTGLYATFVVRYVIATFAVWYVINFLSPLPSPWRHPVHIFAAAIIVALIVYSRRVKLVSIRMERTFLHNLHLRDAQDAVAGKKKPRYAGRLQGRNIHLAQIQLPPNTRWAGCTLSQLSLGERDGVMIAAVIRADCRINVPSGSTRLYPLDRLEALGDDFTLEQLAKRIGSEIEELTPNDVDHQLALRRLIIPPVSPLAGTTLRHNGLRDKYRCMAVGFEADDGSIEPPSPERIIASGDALWVIGEYGDVKRIIAIATANAKQS